MALIMDCDFASIDGVANRFRESIETLEIDTGDQIIKVTASLGVCWADRGKLPAMDQLFKTADSYLYEAKRSGRNRCVVRGCTDAIAS